MTNRMKQVGFIIGLALPLAASAFMSGPFTAPASAQGRQRLVGPANPILADINGNGPDPGDLNVTPQFSNATLYLTTAFSCGTQENTSVGLSAPDGSGRFTSASRQNSFRSQTISVTGSSAGAATNFAYTERDGSGVRASGMGVLLDLNGDGRFDTLSISGNISATINLVFTPDSAFVSIPLSQMALLGASSSKCGLGRVPQIWVPLSDTTGNGRGDTIIFDLNGDGIPDPQFFRSPRLGGLGVPATGNLALAVLIALLGSIGLWFIGRRPPTDRTLRPLI
jgi:hypothetical protein